MAHSARTRVGEESAKPVRVILVGADCTGKTTLADNLRAYYGIASVANRRIPGDLNAIHSVLTFALEVIPHLEFILDQWQYPVDVVYRATLENEQSPIVSIADKLVPHLNENGVLFILLTADPETITARYNVRGDELWNLDQILSVAAVYPAYMKLSGVNYRTIDTSKYSPVEVFDHAIRLISNYGKLGSL